MSRKLLFLGVLTLVLAPGGAFSLGLGDIRLNSYLNQPLDAEIALSLASGDELETLDVDLASREAFDRYGLTRPAFLDDLNFQVVRGPGGPTVKVDSSRPILEPFVTFLLEARWAGGRVLREYTVLLDPPVYVPGEQAAPVVEAPAPTRSAPLRPTAPVAEPRATPAPAPVAAPRDGAEYGPVRRRETLWAIAERVRPDGSVSMNQMMIALFRANPGAFDGNVNRLRAGAILRVPPRQDIASISRGEADAEFRRQTREWRADRPRGPAQARLELVPPAETAPPAAPAAGPSAPSTPAAGTGAAAADSAAQAELLSAVQALRGELDETRRMMEIKDAEIAALQARLAELEAGRDAEPADAEKTEVAVTQPAEGAPAGEEPAAQEPPAAAPEQKPAATPPPPVVTSPSFMDRVLAFLGSLWFWVILGLVLIAGAALHFARNREEASSIGDDLADTGTWGTLDTPKAGTATSGAALSDTRRSRALSEEPDSILVDERQTPQATAGAAAEELEAEAGASEDEYEYPFEDTIAGEAGINLDQSDPLAEADFHMAYGLYDQAAEITKKAVEREPERYDLRLGGEDQVADWGKIAIMGSQICPDEEIFKSEGPVVAEVDVSFEADDASEGESEEEWLDFDVGAAEEESIVIGDTQEQPALDESATSAENTAELNIEALGIDLDLGATGEHALQDLAERAPEFTDETAYVPAPQKDEGTEASSPEEKWLSSNLASGANPTGRTKKVGSPCTRR
jgi:pilus assembly protein FimV